MDEKPKRRPSVSQLSKTPSWVMLGFLFGAASVWFLPRKAPPPERIIVTVSDPAPRQRTEPPQLTTIEAVFERWSDFAVWDANVTQVAMWNTETSDFTDYYEVRRVDGVFYFRTLPQLTNRIIRHGKQPPAECPLRFTETEAQYREWREEGRFERPVETPRRAPSLPRDVPKVAPSADKVENARPQIDARENVPPSP